LSCETVSMRVPGHGTPLSRRGCRFSLVGVVITVALLSSAVPVLGQIGVEVPAKTGTPVALTAAERAWLDTHPDILLVYADGYEPEVIVDPDGTYRGILVDVLSELNTRLGARLTLEVGSVAPELERVRRKEAAGVLAIHPDHARRRGLIGTRVYFWVYPAGFTQRGVDFDEAADLAGKRVAVVDGVYFAEQLIAKYGHGATVLKVRNALEGLGRVSQGEVDVFLGKSTHSFLVTKYQLLGLTQPFLFSDDPVPGAMAVRPDWPILATILDKGLASFDSGEIESTVAKWMGASLPESVLPSVRYQQGLRWSEILPWVGSGLAGAALVVGVVLVWNRALKREVRQRRTAEQRLAHAKEAAERANRTKSLFLANMSHELRTPLNAILGFSSMLDRDPAATSQQKQKLAVINRSGRHLLSMINDILDLSKVEAGRTELEERSFDLVALLEDIGAFVQSRAEEKGLSFSLHTGAVLHPYVRADAGKIRHVLNNLLGNAIKFTSNGGVTLTCETREGASDRRCEVVLEVADTGPGIDPALHARIFEPFVQERSGAGSHDGVGLGLSICRSLTGVMGGALELESELGRGSIFRVWLPAGVAAAEDARTHAETARRVIGLAPGQRRWRILVVDDNADDRAVLKALLEDASFLVLEAANGQEGVEAFTRHAPDLVWMDMRMAVMDGYEAVRQIRQLPRGDRTAVIAMTASAFREQAADILAAGCDDVVVKPASEPSIFEAMQRFLPLKYQYAQDPERARPGGLDELSRQIGALPDTVRHGLRAAAGTLRHKELDAALDAVRALDPDLAGRLAELGQELRFDRILELVAASERS